MTAEARHLIDG